MCVCVLLYYNCIVMSLSEKTVTKCKFYHLPPSCT